MSATRAFLLPLVLGIALLTPTAMGAVGTFGGVASASTTGVVGRLSTFTNAPVIGFLDNNPQDAAAGTSEAVILSFGGDSVVHQNDILLSNPAGSLISGAVGSAITNAPSGTFVASAAQLRFVDTLPIYKEGGPDGVFGPGEGLYLDLDASSGPSAPDRVLVTGNGVSGTLGGAPSTQTETVWDPDTECVYTSADSTVQAANDVVISENSGQCPVADGRALVGITGIKITGADATFSVGVDDAYIAAGSTVTTGDFRITTTAGGAAGTMVNCGVFGAGTEDDDCGVALFTTAPSNLKVTPGSQVYTPVLADIQYFDANGNAVYDLNDRVVMDIDSNGFITPPDVLMSSTGGQTYGSRPTLATGLARAVVGAATLTPTIMWLDGATNPGQYDSNEPVALHLAGGALRLSLGDICWTTVGGCSGGMQRSGSTSAPSTGGTWTDVTTASNAGALGVLDANNNNKFDGGDSLYLHFGPLPGNVAAGDILIASDSGGSGSVVTSAGGALKTLAAVGMTATWKYLDVDGSGTYTYGDLVYLLKAAGTVATPGDVRLNSGNGVSGFGKILKDTDTDAVLALLNVGASGTLFSFRDIDASGTVTSDEPIFLMPRAAAACPLLAPDVNLSPASLSGISAGSFVGSASVVICTAVPGAPQFAYLPVGIFNTDSKLYVDLDGDGIVENGDVSLTTSPGTRHSGASQTATALPLGAMLGARPGNVAISVVDISGDDVAAAGEAVVLDVDGDGYFTPGDVPLSGSASSGGGGGGGGGGGSTTNPTTGATTTSSSSSSSTSTTNSSSSSSSASVTSSTSDGPSTPSLASLNRQLEDSLDVDRDGGQNVLTWDDVDADAYQVWSADSPFVLKDEVPGSQTSYTDEDGDSGTDYLVTACLGACSLTADDVNDGDVPGYTGVPDGEDASAPKGFIPAPSPLLLLGLVLVAALLVRRRL
jgi:hypothetical protein